MGLQIVFYKEFFGALNVVILDMGDILEQAPGHVFTMTAFSLLPLSFLSVSPLNRMLY